MEAVLGGGAGRGDEADEDGDDADGEDGEGAGDLSAPLPPPPAAPPLPLSLPLPPSLSALGARLVMVVAGTRTMSPPALSVGSEDVDTSPSAGSNFGSETHPTRRRASPKTRTM